MKTESEVRAQEAQLRKQIAEAKKELEYLDKFVWLVRFRPEADNETRYNGERFAIGRVAVFDIPYTGMNEKVYPTCEAAETAARELDNQASADWQAFLSC